jgi:hypothetical protein
MVFVLYKINNDNSIILTGVYENENDAIEIKNLYNDDNFKIADLPFWKTESEKKPFIYTEEDNDINESDLEDKPILEDNYIIDDTYMTIRVNLFLIFLCIIYAYLL